jgi:hypothetical protein
MRDHGYHHVGGVLSPVLFEHAHLPAMCQPDQEVHDRQQLARTHSPAAPQHDVVDFLKGNSCIFANEIDRVKQFLGAVKAKLPGFLLFPDNCLE